MSSTTAIPKQWRVLGPALQQQRQESRALAAAAAEGRSQQAVRTRGPAAAVAAPGGTKAWGPHSRSNRGRRRTRRCLMHPSGGRSRSKPG